MFTLHQLLVAQVLVHGPLRGATNSLHDGQKRTGENGENGAFCNGNEGPWPVRRRLSVDQAAFNAFQLFSMGGSEAEQQEASSNKCHASSNRCLTSSNKKLVVTSAT